LLLSHVDTENTELNGWPTKWPLLEPLGEDGHYIGQSIFEQEAYLKEVSPEHKLAREDWGNPGKNRGDDGGGSRERALGGP
jgi:hypothetical protein